MNINLVKIKYSDTYCYKYKPLVFCCSELKNAYEDVYGDYPDIVLTKDGIWTNEDIVYNSPYLCISRSIEDYYDSDYTETKNYPINYCPYCGEKIKYTIDGEKDYTGLCKTLKKVIDDLQKCIETTDSRSGYKELCKYRNYILYILKNINDFDTFKEKLALVNIQDILVTTDKIIKEKGI